MQKIYVLLRHDQQTGPYSLSELIQFDLKPYDLIWIEGQSAGWYYPQEIAALHPYLNFLPKKPAPASPAPPAEKKTAVQMPVTKKAPPPAPLPERTAPVFTEAYKPFAPASENLEDAVYAQFRKPAAKEDASVIATATPQKKKTPSPMVVGTITVLIVGGVFAASWMMSRQPAKEETPTEAIVETPVSNEITLPAVANDENTKREQAVSSTRQKQMGNSVAQTQTTTAVKTATGLTKGEKKTGYPANEATDDEKTGRTMPVKEAEQETSSTTASETTTAPEGKKKSLKEKFLDLFRIKQEEKTGEERRSDEAQNSERVATRRESSASLAQMVHVRFDVPNDWMMGIRGAKAILVNRSSEKIRSATVEVLYYNDDNELLQKKIVTFGKIDAKESGTIAIPDHPTATKVDYNVLSVTGATQSSA